jgi:threonylcarbamoyladenosine tRNA methylthiotransferase MtaB
MSLLENEGRPAKMIAEKDIANLRNDLHSLLPLTVADTKYPVYDGEPMFVVNSCAVTGMAEKKSRYGISKIKKYFPNAKIYSMGCAFTKKSPEEIVGEILGRKVGGGVIIHKREKAFIKVQDGCREFCSFCIIPYKRAELSSREIADVVCEINAQPDYVKEIIISGINLCYFQTAQGETLGELCLAVDKCGRSWYISSLEPSIITEDFVKKLKNCQNYKPNFHICLQSGCDKVLREMNRRYTTAEYLAKINLIRKYFKNAKISTDIIVGYPTETDEDFNATVAFVKTVQFDKIHIFPYSPRKGTKSAEIKPITNSLVTNRFNILNSLNESKNAQSSNFIGKVGR